MIEHVSTLEQGKKLKELGWNKPTKFVWILQDNIPLVVKRADIANWEICKLIPAVMSDEALGELPEKLNLPRDVRFLDIDRERGTWNVIYVGHRVMFNKSLPIAATDMLIWAVENNYVKGEKI